MSRIQKHFARADSAKALVTFITAGDPSVAHTVPALHALAAGGADIIELGIPFSDPEAEGPTIQASSERALAQGVTLKQVLKMVAEFRESNQETPIVLMGYLNSILAMPNFAEQASQAGVDGLIMVNLPPEAAQDIQSDLRQHDIDLIYLIAPTTTDERVKLILEQCSGFVYYVSLKGITGADLLDTDTVQERVTFIKQHTKLPVCVGFGVKDVATAQQVAQVADGVVVGSALVSLLAEHAADVQAAGQALGEQVQALRQGIDAATLEPSP